MKTFLLITTIMFTTPEKDFSGTIILTFKSQVECSMALEKQKDIEMDFSDLMSINIKSKCEEKN